MSATVFKWFAEGLPPHRAVYAIEPMISGANCTRDIHAALSFETKEACQAWCDAHPLPAFEPQEHGFASAPAICPTRPS